MTKSQASNAQVMAATALAISRNIEVAYSSAVRPKSNPTMANPAAMP
jgi:hypothetical protein